MPLACYMLQNPHYDATQYAASCCTKLLKSKYFTQLPIPKHTQFAVISPVRYLSNEQPHQFSPQFHHFKLLLCPQPLGNWSHIIFTEERTQMKPVSFSHSCLPVCSLTYCTHVQQYPHPYVNCFPVGLTKLVATHWTVHTKLSLA